jgi:hypothetical protein
VWIETIESVQQRAFFDGVLARDKISKQVSVVWWRQQDE